MTKKKTNKKQVKNNKQNKKKQNFKLNNPILIIGIILLIIAIASYINFGLIFTLILMLGIGIILGIAKLLDKIKSKPKRRRVINIILIIFFILAILACLAIGGFAIWIIKEAPNFDISMLNKREASIIYDKDGNEIGRWGSELRENITYDDLPEVFIDALIATEDARFFQHNGFDAPRFIKASLGQLAGNSKAGGASTITMQLSTNTYTDPNRKRVRGLDGIIRKFQDIYISVFKLEKNFTKEEIIEYYVNNYDLGNNAFGVEQASQTYFGKSVKDLNLSESALLVGIFNNPTYYNPFLHSDRANDRRGTVLRLMVRHGYITQEEADAADRISVASLLTTKKSTLQYQGYKDTVYQELDNKFGINPNTTSVLVYTNMDPKRQQGLDDIMNSKGSYKWIDDVVESGVVAIESKTGKIVAVGAGRNKTQALSLNIATQETRQIGSTAKPIFDYGPALEYLGWSTYEQILDEPWKYSTGQSINNSDGQFRGWMSIRNALAQSRNIPALKTFQEVQSQVGNKKIAEFAESLGIKPQYDANGKIYESHSLGAFDGTTVLQMAAAYATFANGGTYIEPTTIDKIVYRDNNEVIINKPKQTKVISDSTAFMITDMLVTAVENGLSGGAKIKGVTVAAKTGTTNFDPAKKKTLSGDAVNDSWIVGYDPEYTLAMWYGYRVPTKQYHNHEVQTVIQRGKLYQSLENVIFNKNGKKFDVPSSVKRVCVENGSNPPALPSANTPQDQITCEYFLKGKEPTETSSKYNKLDPVTNLKVTYNENTQKITISWAAATPPIENESFGAFGYNVYYGDVLLNFTTENSYVIEANSNISGKYKVVTTFEKYDGNKSDPAVYNFTYNDPKEENPTYSLSLFGTSPITIPQTGVYSDPEIPVQLLKNGTSINDQINIKSALKIVIKDPDGTVITEIKGSEENKLKLGTYTITYTVTYEGKTYTKTRQVIVQ